MIWRRQSGVPSLKRGFLFALAGGLAFVVYRQPSGVFLVKNSLNLVSSAGIALVSFAVWALLSSRLSLAGALTVTPTRRWSDGWTRSADQYSRTGRQRARTHSFDYEVAKRAFDVLGAALMLAVSAPLLLGWMVLASLCSPGPALIRQERIGRGGRPFKMFKLRTLPLEMLATADRDWSVPATSCWMSFARRVGLDELPQLWNVLRGEMSLVGPRPERPYFVQRFAAELPQYPTRHHLQPGLTGWAQVHGLRGDTSVAKRLEYDLHYLRSWSLGLDVRILLMTVRSVARDILYPKSLAQDALE